MWHYILEHNWVYVCVNLVHDALIILQRAQDTGTFIEVG